MFSPTALTSDQDIVKGDAFAGQYTITSYDFNNLIQYKANPDYKGLLGAREDRHGQREVLRRGVRT